MNTKTLDVVLLMKVFNFFTIYCTIVGEQVVHPQSIYNILFKFVISLSLVNILTFPYEHFNM